MVFIDSYDLALKSVNFSQFKSSEAYTNTKAI